MAAYFLESSALVKKYVRERGTDFVAGFMAMESGNALYVSRLATVEVTSALVRLARGNILSKPELAAALYAFRSELKSASWVVPITPELIDRAVALAEAHALRGYDAVQLATLLWVNEQRVADGGPPVTLVSSDTELNEAATLEGVAVEDPNKHE